MARPLGDGVYEHPLTRELDRTLEAIGADSRSFQNSATAFVVRLPFATIDGVAGIVASGACPPGEPKQRSSREANCAAASRPLDAEEARQEDRLDQSEISTLESGQANPTYRTLQTLAAALGGKIELVIGSGS